MAGDRSARGAPVVTSTRTLVLREGSAARRGVVGVGWGLGVAPMVRRSSAAKAAPRRRQQSDLSIPRGGFARASINPRNIRDSRRSRSRTVFRTSIKNTYIYIRV